MSDTEIDVIVEENDWLPRRPVPVQNDPQASFRVLDWVYSNDNDVDWWFEDEPLHEDCTSHRPTWTEETDRLFPFRPKSSRDGPALVARNDSISNWNDQLPLDQLLSSSLPSSSSSSVFDERPNRLTATLKEFQTPVRLNKLILEDSTFQSSGAVEPER